MGVALYEFGDWVVYMEEVESPAFRVDAGDIFRGKEVGHLTKEVQRCGVRCGLGKLRQ